MRKAVSAYKPHTGVIIRLRWCFQKHQRSEEARGPRVVVTHLFLLYPAKICGTSGQERLSQSVARYTAVKKLILAQLVGRVDDSASARVRNPADPHFGENRSFGERESQKFPVNFWLHPATWCSTISRINLQNVLKHSRPVFAKNN